MSSGNLVGMTLAISAVALRTTSASLEDCIYMVARFAFAITWVIAVYVSGIAIEAKSLSGKRPGEPPLTGDSAQSTKPPPSDIKQEL